MGRMCCSAAQDVLETLNLTMVSQQRAARVALPSDPTEAQLFQTLGRRAPACGRDPLSSGLPIEQVSATLALMELKGLVRQVGGMNYVSVMEQGEEYHVEAAPETGG